MENRKNSNTTKLHLLRENITLGTFSPIPLELPNPAAGGPTCLYSLGMQSHHTCFLGLRMPCENKPLQGQGDWAIHVSTSEHLGLTFFENIFCLRSSVTLTCSLSLFFPVWAEWGQGGKGEGWSGWRLCFQIPSMVVCFSTAIWMPAGCIWACSMGRRLNTSFHRLQNSVSAWHSPGFYLVNR